MHFKKSLLFSAAIIAIGCSTAPLIRADSFLSGDIVGAFRSAGGTNADIVNSLNGDASFRTGMATANSFKSGITFDGASFTGIDSGETIPAGVLKYYNGLTQIGTSSHGAILDLYLRLTDPSMPWIPVGTVSFGIDATVNTLSAGVPDNFLAAYSASSSILIDGGWLQFALNGLPAATSVAENSEVDIGNLTLTWRPSIAVSEETSSLLLAAIGFIAIMSLKGSLAGAASGKRC